MVVDSSGTEVGTVELSTGLVTRRFGDDVVLLFVTPQGFYQGDITFFHTSSDCSGQRYLQNNGGALAYLGQLSGSTVFYTPLSDPSPTQGEAIESYEVVRPGADPMAMGECVTSQLGTQTVGAVKAVTDPTLGNIVPPFRLR
jgi:hypothetical protein